ncbi:hypothetical protein [Tardiphaga sp.]|uniref:hypothetical protein n=1 Tax=Tardiphaga sp. TaxID=1926292 RepID=UPI00260266B7|nr:hypothetical protein [Tardiphaga sp.]
MGGVGVIPLAVALLNEHHEPTQACDLLQPATGRYARYAQLPLVAPLTIRTEGGSNYFIKFQEIGTNRTIMTFFAKGGETIQHKMPNGTYALKYATGETWCGDQKLFGASTQVHETGRLFSFDDEHTYSVELIRQKNGNLPVRTISLKDF